MESARFAGAQLGAQRIMSRFGSLRSGSHRAGHRPFSLAFEDVKRIFNELRIEALLDIDAPLRFEGLRGHDLSGEAQEQRPGVWRQSFELPDEPVEIECPSIFSSAIPARPSAPGTETP